MQSGATVTALRPERNDKELQHVIRGDFATVKAAQVVQEIPVDELY